jgi:PKD repeat protein
MMKTLRTTMTAAAVILWGAVLAQSARISPATNVPGVPPVQSSSPETTACGPDVSDYIFMKEDTASATNANTFYFLDIWPGEKASTAYTMNQAANVTGVMFTGRVKPGSASPTTVELSVWSVDANMMPLTQLGVGTVSVTSTNNFYQVMFTSPVAVTGDFAVAINNIDPLDTLQGIINDYQDAPTQEGLSYYDYQGMWEPIFDVYGIDAEFRILPIVEYSIDADFSFPNVTNCIGNSITFTNNSSPIFSNRMFNANAFDTYFLGETDSTYAWDFGDGSPIVYAASPTHTYAAAGTYTVSLTGMMEGVLVDCSDNQTMVVTVMPNVASSFTVDATQEPMVSFTNTSTGTDGTTIYSWDFGDGNLSSAMSPTNTYAANGTYTVTLTTTGPCGTNMSTQVITITTVGIEQVTALEVKAFFNASEQSLNVTVPAKDAVITVYDMLGQVIHSAKANASTEVISMSGAAAGTYMVRVNTANATGTAKFAVTR